MIQFRAFGGELGLRGSSGKLRTAENIFMAAAQMRENSVILEKRQKTDEHHWFYKKSLYKEIAGKILI